MPQLITSENFVLEHKATLNTFSVLILLVGRQQRHSACKKIQKSQSFCFLETQLSLGQPWKTGLS